MQVLILAQCIDAPGQVALLHHVLAHDLYQATHAEIVRTMSGARVTA
jgi:hypothetical protein